MSVIPEDEIHAAAIPLLAPQRCLYFLIHWEQIVYVGQTNNFQARLQQHAKEKEFDSYAIFQCGHDEDLDAIEAEHIAHYRPRDNQRMPKGSGFLALADLKRRGIGLRLLKKWIQSGLVAPVYMGSGAFYPVSEIEAAQAGGSQ